MSCIAKVTPALTLHQSKMSTMTLEQLLSSEDVDLSKDVAIEVAKNMVRFSLRPPCSSPPPLSRQRPSSGSPLLTVFACQNCDECSNVMKSCIPPRHRMEVQNAMQSVMLSRL